MAVYFTMRVQKRGKKQLHEHEAFLFGFTLVFIIGGFIFWNVPASGLDFYVGDALAGGNSLTFPMVEVDDTSTITFTVRYCF